MTWRTTAARAPAIAAQHGSCARVRADSICRLQQLRGMWCLRQLPFVPAAPSRLSQNSSDTRFRMKRVFDGTMLLYSFDRAARSRRAREATCMYMYTPSRRTEPCLCTGLAAGVRALKAACGQHCVWKLSHGTIASMRSGCRPPISQP